MRFIRATVPDLSRSTRLSPTLTQWTVRSPIASATKVVPMPRTVETRSPVTAIARLASASALSSAARTSASPVRSRLALKALTATALATSPPSRPPIPSASTNTVTPSRSSVAK